MLNKLRNKKVKVFGKSVSVFMIIMLAVMGFGSAALVAYLSNTITGNVVVGQLLTLGVSGTSGGTYGPNVSIGTIRGGDSFDLYTKLTNNGANKVNTTGVKIVVSSTGGTTNVDCNEFTVTAGNSSIGCVDNGHTVTLTTGTISLAANGNQHVVFNVQTDLGIEPATYTFTAAVPRV